MGGVRERKERELVGGVWAEGVKNRSLSAFGRVFVILVLLITSCVFGRRVGEAGEENRTGGGRRKGRDRDMGGGRKPRCING